MVDEYAGELIADCALHECCSDCGVNAAGETADDKAAADLLLDARDLLIDDIGHCPGRCNTRDVVEEVHENVLTVRAVLDLRVVLHSSHAALGILEGCDRCTGRRC